ncbi:MAG: hypothetical protein ABI194_05975 [Gemmatimonadaceae bacterium]
MDLGDLRSGSTVHDWGAMHPTTRQNLFPEQAMHAERGDNRGHWIIIGGAIGATVGTAVHELPLALALGIAAGMGIGGLLNRLTAHPRD